MTLVAKFASKLTHDKRVHEIEIYHLDLATPIRTIDFDLAASFNDNHPCGQGHRGSKSYLVTAIRELGVGGNHALPATTFSYDQLNHTSHGSCYRYMHLSAIENGPRGPGRVCCNARWASDTGLDRPGAKLWTLLLRDRTAHV